DFAIAESFCHAADYVQFARRQKRISVRAGKRHRNRLRHRLQQEVQLVAAGPDLSLMDAANRLCEQFKRLGAAEDPTRSGAEGLDDGRALRRIEQHNDPRGRGTGPDLPAQAETSAAVSALTSANQGHIRVIALNGGKNLNPAACGRGHGELAVAAKSLDQQLCIHGSIVGREYANPVLQWETGQLSHDGETTLNRFESPSSPRGLFLWTITRSVVRGVRCKFWLRVVNLPPQARLAAAAKS